MDHRFRPANVQANWKVDNRLKALAIELLCNAIPTAAVAFDAQYRVLFSNREGLDFMNRWNAELTNRPAARQRSQSTVPAEIVAACNQLRQGGSEVTSRPGRPKFGGRVFVRHPSNPNLSAVVALERSARDRRVAVFCALLQDQLKDNLVAGRRDHLAMLTIAERRVAKLVAEGRRNREIAESLGKSVTTVKSQLSTVFSKLQVQSRTQLAATLRSI